MRYRRGTALPGGSRSPGIPGSEVSWAATLSFLSHSEQTHTGSIASTHTQVMATWSSGRTQDISFLWLEGFPLSPLSSCGSLSKVLLLLELGGRFHLRQDNCELLTRASYISGNWLSDYDQTYEGQWKEPLTLHPFPGDAWNRTISHLHVNRGHQCADPLFKLKFSWQE